MNPLPDTSKMNCLYPFFTVVLLFTCNKTIAQKTSQQKSSAYNSVTAYYESEIADRSHIFTGKEYAKYKSGIQGTQFFLSPQMENGSLFYDGTLYDDVPLLFDLVRHEVVINRYDDNTRIKLINEKIKYFIISGHRFESLAFKERDDGEINKDFYEIAFDGRAKVLINRIKKVEMTLNPEDPPKFTERDKIFIQNGNKIYPADNASSLLKALGDKKDIVKTFIRKNKFRFKSSAEEEIVKTVAYYETLIN